MKMIYSFEYDEDLPAAEEQAKAVRDLIIEGSKSQTFKKVDITSRPKERERSCEGNHPGYRYHHGACPECGIKWS